MLHMVISFVEITKKTRIMKYLISSLTCRRSRAMATRGVSLSPAPTTICSSSSADRTELILAASRSLSATKYSITLIYGEKRREGRKEEMRGKRREGRGGRVGKRREGREEEREVERRGKWRGKG